MVQTLNLILLTAPELGSLRKTLKDASHLRGGRTDSFEALFKCWSHNSVSTFSLCLLAEAYDLSAALILKFAEVDVTVGFPAGGQARAAAGVAHFIHLRIQLLKQSPSHKSLLKSLYGLLMLLPQSQAYKTLSDRLATVSSMQMHLSSLGAEAQKKLEMSGRGTRC